MASSMKTLTFAAVLMILLLLQQECFFTSARKTQRSHARKMPRGSLRNLRHAPALVYVINPNKKAQTNAFRPTSPDPSPGVGNDRPPAARKIPRSHARKMSRGSSRKLRHAPAMVYVINPYKKAQIDAFRPTSPGPIPGVGNHRPPGSVMVSLWYVLPLYLLGRYCMNNIANKPRCAFI